jgi:hypothetical protein
MQPVQTPITGREDLGDLRSPVQALAQFYAAFNRRDLHSMSRNWLQSADVAMDNPLGGIARGWQAIRAVYERLFTGLARVSVEFYDYTIHSTPDLFYAVGRERGTLQGVRSMPSWPSGPPACFSAWGTHGSKCTITVPSRTPSCSSAIRRWSSSHSRLNQARQPTRCSARLMRQPLGMRRDEPARCEGVQVSHKGLAGHAGPESCVDPVSDLIHRKGPHDEPPRVRP